MGRLVEHSLDRGVVTLTLDRPEANNAFNDELKTDLLAAVTGAATEPDCRALLIAARGKAFSVGQDLAEHAENLKNRPDAPLGTVREHYNPLTRALAEFPRPVIVAINGACVGAALGIALACDLRVAGESAKLGTAFAGIGLGPDSGLSVSLRDAVGSARATELLLLPDPISAQRAWEWGLLTRVVPDEEVETESRALVDQLAQGATTAYAEIKRVLRENADRDLSTALEAEADVQQRLGRTSDHQNAVTAFLAKQQPTFGQS